MRKKNSLKKFFMCLLSVIMVLSQISVARADDGSNTAPSSGQVATGDSGTTVDPASTSTPQAIWISNNWKSNEYLYDDGQGNLMYGQPTSTNKSFQWVIEADGAHERIKNVSTGNYIAEKDLAGDPSQDWNKVVVCTGKVDNDDNQLWDIPTASNAGYNLIKSVAFANKGYLLNVQAQLMIPGSDTNGYVEGHSVDPTWGSPQWKFTNVDPVSYVRIQNSYKDKEYLFDNGNGELQYGYPTTEDQSYQWEIVNDGGHQRIINRATGNSIAEKGLVGDPGSDWGKHVACIAKADGDENQLWDVSTASNSLNKLIKSVSFSDKGYLLNVQAQLAGSKDGEGYVEGHSVDPTWGSPQWIFQDYMIPVPVLVPDKYTPYVRISNFFRGMNLYEDNNIVKYGNVPATDMRSQWIIVDGDGNAAKDYVGTRFIKNRATGHYINISGNVDNSTPVACTDTNTAATSQWNIAKGAESGCYTFNIVGNANNYLHIENKLGYLQWSNIPPTWGTPQWRITPYYDGDYTANTQNYFRIRDSWKGNYLYEEVESGNSNMGLVKYGQPNVNDASSQWILEVQGNNFRIKNRGTGHYIEVEDVKTTQDPLTCSGTIPADWTSSQWSLAPAPGDDGTKGYQIIQNVFKSGQYIHVSDQTGYAQCSDMSQATNWGSVHMMLEPTNAKQIDIPTGYVRLKNKQANTYLYENAHGVILYGNSDANDESSQWSVEASNGSMKLKNRATGNYMSLKNSLEFIEGLNSDTSTSALWSIEYSNQKDYYLIRNIAKNTSYVNETDSLGFPQCYLIDNNVDSALWAVEAVSNPEAGVLPTPEKSSNVTTITVFKEGGYVRIIDKATGKYLSEKDGNTQLVVNALNDNTDLWTIEDYNGKERVKNKATSHYFDLASVINISNFSLEKIKDNISYEAESAILLGGAQAANSVAGFSGKGYVHGFNTKGAAAEFSINAPVAGSYSVDIRYFNSSNSQTTLALYVNGKKVKDTSLINSNTWRINEESLSLRSGINTITIQKDTEDNVDALVDNITVINGINNSYRGATLPYEEYEAEYGNTNGTIVGPSRAYYNIASEASGREAVILDQTGKYVEFKLTKPANSIVIRYSIPDSADGKGNNAPINLYVNGQLNKQIGLTSKYSWIYGSYPYSNNPGDQNPHRFFDETRSLLSEMPAGTVVRLQKDDNCTATNYIIDFADFEEVVPELTKPDNFIPITDHGAKADSGVDASQAIKDTIAEAEAKNEGVWIPAGTFTVNNDPSTNPLTVKGITVRGEGMWYSTLSGSGAAFDMEGDNNKFYDFSLMGDTDHRDDSSLAVGFSSTELKAVPGSGVGGKGDVIQDVWVEHTKSGVWTSKLTDSLQIIGSRFRDTFADGINLCNGTSNSVVEQNNIRNTGDDAVAIWSATGFGTTDPDINNTVRFNTIQLPMLANNVAVYGGTDNKVQDNMILDTVAFGAGVNISSNFSAVPFSGNTLVERNTLLRCGGHEYNWNIDYGAIWINCANSDINGKVTFNDNNIFQSSYQGISVLGPDAVTNTTFNNTVVDGTGTWGVNASGGTRGSITFNNLVLRNTKVGNSFDGTNGALIMTTNDVSNPTNYTVTYVAGANGTITGNLSQTVNKGDNATEVIAVANTGYHFVSWSDGKTTASRTDSNISGNISVTANFAVNIQSPPNPTNYTVTYVAGANGTITGNLSQTVKEGDNATEVTALANTGYHFVSWSDGKTTASRTDSNISGNISVTANFDVNIQSPQNPIGIGNNGNNISIPNGDSTEIISNINNSGNSSVTVDVANNKTVTKDIFDALKGHDKDVIFVQDGIQWTFNGKNITGDTKDINMTVQVASLDTSKAPNQAAISDKLKDTKAVVISFANNGQLPGRATVKIKLNSTLLSSLDKNNLNIYYYNETTKQFETIANSLTVDAEGYVQFNITHNSDYVVTSEKLAVIPSELRLGGKDRYETSVKVSQNSFATSDNIVLATGDNYADALCAAPFAKQLNAPILLTASTKLVDSVVAEITRLKAKKVYIVGKEGAISADIENTIKAMGLSTERIGGDTRYGTALAIAEKINTKTEAFLCTGNDFPDALSISAYAAAIGAPILLTDKNNVSAEVLSFIKNNNTKVYVIGGAGVIGNEVLNSISGSERIAGNDRYGTNAAVISKFNTDFDFTNVYLATGSNYPDAICGAAAAAISKTPIIIVDSSKIDSIKALISSEQGKLNKVVILGGEAVVNTQLVNSLFN